MHSAMIPVVVIAAVAVVLVARSTATRLAAAVFGLSIVAVFVTSSIFNRRWWSDRAWQLMRQVDQTAIYGLIGGTFTGLIAVAPDGEIRVWWLSFMWAALVAGVGLRWAPFHLPVGLQSGLFVVFGVFGGTSVVLLVDQGSVLSAWLLVIGGLLYIAGVIVLGLRRPDPWPTTFGYHEIWHVMVVVALSMHYMAVVEVVS
jgi:hemolysin III